MLPWTEYVKIFVTLLVIINPVSNSPIFLSITSSQNSQQRNRTAAITALTACAILIVSAVVGQRILDLFGIGIPAFRVGGGILLLLIAISMLQARVSRSSHVPEEAAEATDRATVAVVPLGVPLLAGPGAISAVIIYGENGGVWYHPLLICTIIIGVSVGIWITLRLSVWMGKLIGQTGINIVTRLMGLVLIAIAVEFITGGLRELLPGLSGG